MELPSPAPRRVATPRWLDLRIVLGVALVLAAVVLGAVVVSRARHTTQQVAVTHDLAAGATLRASDLILVDAQLPDTSPYLDDPGTAVGKVLTRPLGSGELVPAAAVAAAPARTTVTIPFAADTAPELRRGERIVVWLSTPTCPSTVLLPDVTVQDVQDSGGGAFSSAGGQDAVVAVAPELATRVTGALALDHAVIRAGVLSGAPADPRTLPSLADCAPSDAP